MLTSQPLDGGFLVALYVVAGLLLLYIVTGLLCVSPLNRCLCHRWIAVLVVDWWMHMSSLHCCLYCRCIALYVLAGLLLYP